MNTTNAFGFLVTGLIAEALHLLPSITGAREMWLMVMGGVLMLVGVAFIALETWLWVKPRMVTPMLALLPLRAAAGERSLAQGQGGRATV
jgi:hypothetical protein